MNVIIMKAHTKHFEDFGKVQDEIKFLTKSEIRLEILKCLDESPYTVKEIVENTGMTYSSVSSNMNKLEKNKNIYKKDNKFRISYLTKIYFENIIHFKKSLEVISNFEEFWNKHDINNLDYDSVKNITDLYDSELVKSTSTDIYKIYNTIKAQIVNSEKIMAIFPYLHPDFPKLVEDELRKGAEIQLIINDAIHKSLILGIDEDLRKECLKNKKLKIHTVKNDLKIYLTICDDEMSLGLFKNDNSFDQNRILISSAKQARRWAEKLFAQIKEEL